MAVGDSNSGFSPTHPTTLLSFYCPLIVQNNLFSGIISGVEIQQTIQIVISPDEDLLQTLGVFQEVKQSLSETCFNKGNPLGQLGLHRAMYKTLAGRLCSQMTCSAIRLVAGAYASAKRNKKPAKAPFGFHKRHALFLVGKRGRDASFKKDLLSIWTIAGRKKIAFTVPEYFQPVFDRAKEIDSLNVVHRNGQLIGFVCVTLEVPDPAGVLPIGVDLNETNILVAIDPEDRELFISGKPMKIANTKTRKVRKRLQKKLASRKAEGRSTRSVRRNLKRLACKQRNRTKTFCQIVAKQLVQWCPSNAVLVLEDLSIPQVSKRMKLGKGVKRRLSQWARGLLTTWIRANAQKHGVLVELVNPAHTSTHCSHCGLAGNRKRHRFVCPFCGYTGHADINAAVNIRNRYTVLRGGGVLSTTPEALE